MTQYWIGRESGICTSLVTLPFSTRWHLTPAMPQCHVPLILIYLWSNSPFPVLSCLLSSQYTVPQFISSQTENLGIIFDSFFLLVSPTQYNSLLFPFPKRHLKSTCFSLSHPPQAKPPKSLIYTTVVDYYIFLFYFYLYTVYYPKCHVMRKAEITVMQLQDKEHQGFLASHQKLRDTQNRFSPRATRRNQPHQYLDFQLPASEP